MKHIAVCIVGSSLVLVLMVVLVGGAQEPPQPSAPLARIAQTAPPPPEPPQAPERHRAMHRALHALQNARRALDKAEHNFQGHRAKALEHIEKAMQEIQAGLNTDPQ
jgi:hypothetical protein